MAPENRNKVEKDIEELKKQIWLLTLKVKNLRESTNKMKRDIRTSFSGDSSVSDKKDNKKDSEKDLDEFFREFD